MRLTAALGSEPRARLDYLQRNGLEVEVFDLLPEVPLPTLLVRVTARKSRGNWPRGGALMVSAAGLSPQLALNGALKVASGQFISLGLQPDPSRTR